MSTASFEFINEQNYTDMKNKRGAINSTNVDQFIKALEQNHKCQLQVVQNPSQKYVMLF